MSLMLYARSQRDRSSGEAEAIDRFIAERGVTNCEPGDGGLATEICAYCAKRVPLKDFPISAVGNRSSVCKWCRSSSWTRSYARRRGDHDAKRIAALEVYERDGWLCQICGKPIDPDLRFPFVMSKTTDHVVPLTKGGQHEVDNLQAAHLYCNILKGNRLEGESRSARAKRQKALGDLLIGR